MTDFYEPPPTAFDRAAAWLRAGGGGFLFKVALLVAGLAVLVRFRRRRSP